MTTVARTIGRIRSDPLLRHSLLLLVAAQVGNGANLLFQWVMFRRLAAAEYGALMAVSSTALALALPMEALRSTVARQVARRRTAGGGGAALRRVTGRWALGLAALGLALVAAAAVAAAPLAASFSLSDPALVPLAAALAAALLFLPLWSGALQGLQAFGWYAATGQAAGIGRLVFGLAFIHAVSATARAALAGHALAVALAVLAALAGWRIAAGRAESAAPAEDPEEDRAEVGFFLRALPALTAFGVLLSADVPLAKLLFPPDLAGAFARAATLARTVVFLPMPVALAVFPKIVARASDAAEARALARRAALYTIGLIAAAAAGAWIFGAPLWGFFAGRAPEAGELRMLRALALALAPLGGIYLQVNVRLARGDWRTPLRLVPAAVAYVLWARFASRGDPLGIALALGTCAAAGLLAISWPSRR